MINELKKRIEELERKNEWLKKDKLPTLIAGSNEAILNLKILELLKSQLEILKEWLKREEEILQKINTMTKLNKGRKEIGIYTLEDLKKSIEETNR